MKNGRLMQDIHPVHCFPSTIAAAYEDFFNGDPAGDVINLENYGQVTFFVYTAAGATGTAVATVESCDDVTPSNTTAIAFKYWNGTAGDTWSDMQDATASGFTIAAGINTFCAITVSAEALSGTDKFVRLQLTEGVDSPVDGGAFAILSNPRYAHEVPATVLA